MDDCSRLPRYDLYALFDMCSPETTTIGSGTFATVYAARAAQTIQSDLIGFHIQQGSKYAVKLITDNLADVNREIDALQKLKGSPHTCTLRGYFIDTWNRGVVLVLDLVLGRTLLQELQDTGPLPEDRALYYLQLLLEAAQDIHYADVAHRDLKPENIIVVHSKNRACTRLVVLDFGLSLTATDEMHKGPFHQGSPGSLAFLPWEALLYPGRMGTWADLLKVDAHAIGVILFAMLTSRFPFSTAQPEAHQIAESIEQGPPFSRSRVSVSDDTQALCASLTAADVTMRLTVAKAVQQTKHIIKMNRRARKASRKAKVMNKAPPGTKGHPHSPATDDAFTTEGRSSAEVATTTLPVSFAHLSGREHLPRDGDTTNPIISHMENQPSGRHLKPDPASSIPETDPRVWDNSSGHKTEVYVPNEPTLN